MRVKANNFQLNLARHSGEGEEIIIIMTRKKEEMEEGKKAHVWAATYSGGMVSIVASERAEEKVAEQSQSARGSNFFLLFGGRNYSVLPHKRLPNKVL